MNELDRAMYIADAIDYAEKVREDLDYLMLLAREMNNPGEDEEMDLIGEFENAMITTQQNLRVLQNQLEACQEEIDADSFEIVFTEPPVGNKDSN